MGLMKNLFGCNIKDKNKVKTLIKDNMVLIHQLANDQEILFDTSIKGLVDATRLGKSLVCHFNKHREWKYRYIIQDMISAKFNYKGEFLFTIIMYSNKSSFEIHNKDFNLFKNSERVDNPTNYLTDDEIDLMVVKCLNLLFKKYKLRLKLKEGNDLFIEEILNKSKKIKAKKHKETIKKFINE